MNIYTQQEAHHSNHNSWLHIQLISSEMFSEEDCIERCVTACQILLVCEAKFPQYASSLQVKYVQWKEVPA
jgi:hypothetical protein